MATINTCDRYLLISNGIDVGVVPFSFPGRLQTLTVPNFQAASRGDPTQASLPPHKRGAAASSGSVTASNNSAGASRNETARRNGGFRGADSKANGDGSGAMEKGGKEIGGVEVPISKQKTDSGVDATLLPSGSVGEGGGSSSLESKPGPAERRTATEVSVIRDGTREAPKTEQSQSGGAEPNYIRAITISHSGSYVALCDDRKYLHVYQVTDGQTTLLSSRCTARRCTAACFSPDEELIVVADKSGDAYSFPTLAQQTQGQGRAGVTGGEQREGTAESGVRRKGDGSGDEEEGEGMAEEENEEDEGGSSKEGTLLLGHLSMLLGVLLVDSGRLVVTCDRDEKIRLSRFPDAYNIEAYCLGHTEFVIGLAYDESSKTVLSASGDCTVRAWTLQGSQLSCRNVLEDLSSQAGTGVTEATDPAAVVQEESANQQDGGTDGCQKDSQRHRPSIKQMTYCPACRLVFIAMDRSADILVYRLQVGSSLQEQAILSHVTTLRSNHCYPEDKLSSFPASTEASADLPVVSLHIQGCVLWVLRQGADSKLYVSAYTVSLGEGDKVQILPVTKGSMEDQVLATVSGHTDFLTARLSSDDLLPFLWKSSFQDDFKFQCNIKRAKPENSRQGKKARGGKKAKLAGGRGEGGEDGSQKAIQS